MRVAVKHATGTHGFPPHFAQGKFRGAFAEKINKLSVGHDTFVPVYDGILNIVLQITGQLDSAGWKGGLPVIDDLRETRSKRYKTGANITVKIFVVI
jgi:hypothetical protein